MRFFAVIALASMVSLPLQGCSNTIRGAGADLEKAGQSIQKCC